MKKALIIEPKGTLFQENENSDQQSNNFIEFQPGVFRYLSKIADEGRFEFILIYEDISSSNPKWSEVFKNEGIDFSRSIQLIDADLKNALDGLFQSGFDLKNSFLISSNYDRMELAKKLGCQSILFGERLQDGSDYTVGNWKTAFEIIHASSRVVNIQRNTHETKIRIKLNPDGSGQSEINTGLRFFDHMLEQIAKHGMLDLEIQCQGDLDIDEHHTIEDIAISLGEAFLQALGDKRGIARYGFLLPMDESLAQVAIDFGGRPWLVWNAEFKREKVGDMPTEMFMHFFKSFSDSAKCNLNIKVEGENEHHKIEAIFKAFAKAIRAAIERNDKMILPSTKGML